MPKDYKLCPKCNNALDNNVMQCPYCGEKIWTNFGFNNWNFQNQEIPNNQLKNNKWWLTVFIILFIVPFIGGIISLIIEIITSLLK